MIKTSTRQTYFLPVIGLVEPEEMKPGDLVGVNKDSYLVLEKLPAEYDSRVKAMEVDARPTEQYSDIGGLDKQIQELIEAVVLPMTHREKFENIGIKPPKGVLLFGPPGTGKTLMARYCRVKMVFEFVGVRQCCNQYVSIYLEKTIFFSCVLYIQKSLHIKIRPCLGSDPSSPSFLTNKLSFEILPYLFRGIVPFLVVYRKFICTGFFCRVIPARPLRMGI